MKTHLTRTLVQLWLVLVSPCSAADAPASTNAPSPSERVFVTIKEKGSRKDDHGQMVTSKVLSALGAWPCQTSIEEKFFRDFVGPVKELADEGPFIARCLEQRTLSPTGSRPDGGSFRFKRSDLSDLLFRPQKYPVRLGATADGDTKVTITISWSPGGSYGVTGGPAIQVSKPGCEVEFERPAGKKKSSKFTPPEHSSYTRGWPIVYWSGDIGSFISGLSKEFGEQKEAK